MSHVRHRRVGLCNVFSPGSKEYSVIGSRRLREGGDCDRAYSVLCVDGQSESIAGPGRRRHQQHSIICTMLLYMSQARSSLGRSTETLRGSVAWSDEEVARKASRGRLSHGGKSHCKWCLAEL